MALSREEAEQNGLKFYLEGEARPEDPDQEIYAADLTEGGHTVNFAGKSEEEILAQAERHLLSVGRLKKESSVGEAEPTQAQESDVEALDAFLGQRDETSEELVKQVEERSDVPDGEDVAPGVQRR
jgi:hypothetical protein